MRDEWTDDEDDCDDEEEVHERETLKRLRKNEDEDCDRVENDDTGENDNEEERDNEEENDDENGENNKAEENNEERENNEEEENNEEGEGENDDEDDEDSAAEEDESDEDGIHVDEHDNGDQNDLPGRRKLRNRRVNSLEAALNQANYTRYNPPSTRKIVSGVLKKKKHDMPEVTITWSNQPPDRRGPGRRPATHIVDPRAGTVIGRAKEAMTEADVFSLFFDEDILALIITYTNRKIQNYNEEEENRQKQVATTDLVELRGFLGLFYMRAFFRIVHKT